LSRVSAGKNEFMKMASATDILFWDKFAALPINAPKSILFVLK